MRQGTDPYTLGMPEVKNGPAVAMDVLAVGEVLASLSGGPGRLADSPALRMSIGGAECSVVIGLARLGLRTALLARVGADLFGEEIVQTLRSEGVDASHVTVTPGAGTALMVRERRAADRVATHYYRDPSAARQLTVADLPEVAPRHAHVGGAALALGPAQQDLAGRLLARTRRAGGSTSFAPGYRPRVTNWADALASWRGILPHVDDLICSEQEALVLARTDDVEQALRTLLDLGPRRVVVRRGERGAIGQQSGGRIVDVPAVPARVLDTAGVGAAFTVGYLCERLNSGDLPQSLAAGAWVASLVASAPGDYEGLPSWEVFGRWRAGTAVAG